MPHFLLIYREKVRFWKPRFCEKFVKSSTNEEHGVQDTCGQTMWPVIVAYTIPRLSSVPGYAGTQGCQGEIAHADTLTEKAV